MPVNYSYMKTKLICLFLITLFSVQPVHAKKAKAIWYFLEKTHTSVTGDDNISIQYGITLSMQMKKSLNDWRLLMKPLTRLCV